MRQALGIVVVLVLFLFNGFHVYGEENSSPLKISWNTSVASHYVGYLGYDLSRDPVAQNEVVVAGTHARASVWWCTGTNDTVFSSDRADEVDLFFSWKMKYGQYSVTPELVYQCFFPLEKSDGDALVPRIKLTRAGHALWGGQCTVGVQFENRLTLPAFDRRPTATLVASDSFTLGHGMTWTIGGSALADAGNKKADSGVIVQWKTDLSVVFSERVTGQVFVKYFDPVGINARDGREEETVVGFGMTITF